MRRLTTTIRSVSYRTYLDRVEIAESQIHYPCAAPTLSVVAPQTLQLLEDLSFSFLYHRFLAY